MTRSGVGRAAPLAVAAWTWIRKCFPAGTDPLRATVPFAGPVPVAERYWIDLPESEIAEAVGL